MARSRLRVPTSPRMIKQIFYIDEPQCCFKSASSARLGDLYYVVDPPLIDVLLSLNVPPEAILTPLSLLTHYESHISLCSYYAKLEETIVDQYSYINWLLCNQALLIQFLDSIVDSEYHNDFFNIITFRPAFYLDERLNSGLPISIYYYLRDHACTLITQGTKYHHFSTRIWFSIKHTSYSIIRHCIPTILAWKSIYKIFGYEVPKNGTLITGTGVPTTKLDHIRLNHTNYLQLKPVSEFRFDDLMYNTIYYCDFISADELRSWKLLVVNLVPRMLSLASNSLETDLSSTYRHDDALLFNINSIIDRLSTCYRTPLRLSANAYLSDHINLFTFAFLSALKKDPNIYQLIAHGGVRRSPICRQLIINKVLSPDYQLLTSTESPPSCRESIVLTNKIPLIIVSYASFKRVGFKIKPVHLYRFNKFISELLHISSQASHNWPLYVAKKPYSESFLSNIDLVPALQYTPIISTKCIPSKFPTAIVIAVGQLGTAHVQLANSGYQILYFGDDPNQSTIKMSHYKFFFSSNGALLLEPHRTSDDTSQQSNVFYMSY